MLCTVRMETNYIDISSDLDLEDGEIRDTDEGDYDDVSDCTLPELVTTMQEQELDDDLELLREEALKTIYPNDAENDELEEEQCRLEALQSLLLNMEEEEEENENSESQNKSNVNYNTKTESHEGYRTLERMSWYPRPENALMIESQSDDEDDKIRNMSDNISVKSCESEATSLNQESNINTNRLIHVKQNGCFNLQIPTTMASKTPTPIRTKNQKYKLVNKSSMYSKNSPPNRRSSLFVGERKSKYSFRRSICPKVTIDPKEFIIHLDENDDSDSSKDEEEIKSYDHNKNVMIIENSKSDRNSPKEQGKSPTFEDQNASSRVAVSETREDVSKNHCQPKQIDSSILDDAEMNLMSIREKLLKDFEELDYAIKQTDVEENELKELMKKFAKMQNYIKKFEEKIALQRCKVSKSNIYIKSLICGVNLRYDNCAQFRNICFKAGKQLLGTTYRAPDKYDEEILIKKRKIDVSKYSKHK